MPGNREKAFTDYIRSEQMDALEYYREQPASMFLQNIVHISDSIDHCIRNFPKKKDKSFTAKSKEFLDELSAAAVCSIMGHFELYQKSCFASLIELSRKFNNFNIDNCVRTLEKESNLAIDVKHLLAYRGEKAATGMLIADNLYSWHDPSAVNRHFKSIFKDINLFSNNEIKSLSALWQIRHSMAHTGGYLTKHDAEKIASLKKHGDMAIYLEKNFILATTRRLHKITKLTMGRVDKALQQSLTKDDYESDEIQEFIFVHSRRASWL